MASMTTMDAIHSTKWEEKPTLFKFLSDLASEQMPLMHKVATMVQKDYYPTDMSYSDINKYMGYQIPFSVVLAKAGPKFETRCLAVLHEIIDKDLIVLKPELKSKLKPELQQMDRYYIENSKRIDAAFADRQKKTAKALSEQQHRCHIDRIDPAASNLEFAKSCFLHDSNAVDQFAVYLYRIPEFYNASVAVLPLYNTMDEAKQLCQELDNSSKLLDEAIDWLTGTVNTEPFDFNPMLHARKCFANERNYVGRFILYLRDKDQFKEAYINLLAHDEENSQMCRLWREFAKSKDFLDTAVNWLKQNA